MLRPSVSCRTSVSASFYELRQVKQCLLRFSPPDPRKSQKIVNQIPHALGRVQDHRHIVVALFIDNGSSLLLKELCITSHVAEGRTQVMRDGISKRLQFLVDGFEICGTLCKFLVEALNFFFPALPFRNVVVRFQNGDRSFLFVAPQGPSARHHHLRSVRFGLLKLTLPTVWL